MLHSLLQLAQATPVPAIPETLPPWLQGIIALVLVVGGVSGKHAWSAYRNPKQAHPTREEFQGLATKVDKMDGTLVGVDKNVGRILEHLLK